MTTNLDSMATRLTGCLIVLFGPDAVAHHGHLVAVRPAATTMYIRVATDPDGNPEATVSSDATPPLAPATLRRNRGGEDDHCLRVCQTVARMCLAADL